MAKQEQSFGEIFHGLFYDVIRSAGVALNSDQLAKVRQRTDILAKAIEVQAERKAIEVAKRLQKATSDGFHLMAEDIAKNTEAINSLNKNIEPQAKIDPLLEIWTEVETNSDNGLN